MTENQKDISKKKTRRWHYMLVLLALIFIVGLAIFMIRQYEQKKLQDSANNFIEKTRSGRGQTVATDDLDWLDGFFEDDDFEALFVRARRSLEDPLNAKKINLLLNLLKNDLLVAINGGNGFGIFSKRELPVVTTLAKIEQDFKKNVVAGDRAYVNKTIIFPAKVNRIERISTDYYLIDLKWKQDSFSNLRILMKHENLDLSAKQKNLEFLAGLKKNDEVTLSCETSSGRKAVAIPLICSECLSFDHWLDFTVNDYFIGLGRKLKGNNHSTLNLVSTAIATASRLPESSPLFEDILSKDKLILEIKKLPTIPNNEIRKITAKILATATAHTDKHKKPEFSISFPLGWREIPRNILDEHAKILAKRNPDYPVQHYDYGFQLESSENWFEYPYILIKIENSGRIPQKDLEKFEQFPLQEDAEEYAGKFSFGVSEIQAGKLIFDKQNSMIWGRLEMNSAGIGPITTLQSMIPTEKGIIIVVGSCSAADSSTYEPIFRSIILSTLPSTELVYRPRWTDNLPTAISRINWEKAIGKSTGKIIILNP